MATITSVSVDCATSQITLNGTGLSGSPVFSVKVDGVPVSYSLISAASTKAIIQITSFADGQYCIAFVDTDILTSDASGLITSDSATIYTVQDTGFFCADFVCSTQVLESSTTPWKLYRFDLKIRSEETV